MLPAPRTVLLGVALLHESASCSKVNTSSRGLGAGHICSWQAPAREEAAAAVPAMEVGIQVRNATAGVNAHAVSNGYFVRSAAETGCGSQLQSHCF